MPTVTAYMLVGEAHPNMGGIIPDYILYLFENDRPTWRLEPTGFGGPQSTPSVFWNPSIEDMLEDGLLMIGLFVLCDERLTALMQRATSKPLTDQIIVPTDLDGAQLPTIYQTCREVLVGRKVVLSVLQGSTVAGQTAVLADYKMDVEVCPSTFSREYSVWRGETITTGTL